MPQMTADEAFGTDTLTADQAFGSDQLPQTTSQYIGKFADDFFKQTSVGRVMSAFGQGAENEWGANSLDLDSEAKGWLSKSGVAKDFISQHKELAKSANEDFVRPIAHLVDLGINDVRGAIGAVSGATGQIGSELIKEAQSIPQSPLAGQAHIPSPEEALRFAGKTILGGTGDILQNVAGGEFSDEPGNNAQAAFLPEGGIEHQEVAKARAHGVIGEGEEGFFNTRTPSPEALEARTEASKEAGMDVPPPLQKPVTDLHVLARQIDPDNVGEWDKLKDLQENLRLNRTYLQGQMEDIGYKAPLQSKIREVGEHLQTIDEQMQELFPKVVDARQRAEDMLNSQGPEGEAYRKMVQAQIFEHHLKMMDLEPSVDDAYNHAQNLVPTEEKTLDPTQDISKSGTGTPTDETSKVPVKEEPVNALKPVEGTGDTKVRGLAKNLEADFIEKGFADSLGELPEYKGLKLRDQAEKTSEFIKSDPDMAVRVAQGYESPPEGILHASVWKALRDIAAKSGDVELGRKLAQGDTPAQIGTMAQNLRVLRDVDETDPTGIIKNIEDNRRAKADIEVKQEAKNISNQVKKYLASEPIDPEEWESFIN